MQNGILMKINSQLSAINRVWESEVSDYDVYSVFNPVQSQLSDAASPQYIVMDISSNPKFPLRETITAALFGFYRHPMAAEWLAVGVCEQWKFAEQMLVKATNGRKMRWFRDIAEAEEYIKQRLAYI